ncbi:hypothetical protein PM082_003142 [Marasmius tenuissimus]|nr:hypothetical protein PM082_003142 [Marasmius tenuissimus]
MHQGDQSHPNPFQDSKWSLRRKAADTMKNIATSSKAKSKPLGSTQPSSKASPFATSSLVNLEVTVLTFHRQSTPTASQVGRRLYDGYQKRAAKYNGSIPAECRVSFA